MSYDIELRSVRQRENIDIKESSVSLKAFKGMRRKRKKRDLITYNIVICRTKV